MKTFLIGLATSAALSVAVAAPAASAATHPAAVPRPKVWKHVWHDASSFYGRPPSGDPHGRRTGGVLLAGKNYFYCQMKGPEVYALGYHNDWWLLTDDDSGFDAVWVTAIDVSGGHNNGHIPGVPHC